MRKQATLRVGKALVQRKRANLQKVRVSYLALEEDLPISNAIQRQMNDSEFVYFFLELLANDTSAVNSGLIEAMFCFVLLRNPALICSAVTLKENTRYCRQL